jgi:CRP-like cAMP-binding protein
MLDHHEAVLSLSAKMQYLSEMAVFQDLSPRELEELNRITTMSAVPCGRVFYRPGEPGEILFILKRGRVNLYRMTPDGRKFITTTLGPHMIFGEMVLTGTRLHNTFAEAAEDCLICVMSRRDLERLILAKPQIALRLLTIIGRRLQEFEARLELLAFKGIPARLGSVLLELAEAEASDEINGLTHQELAERVGTYRETATQILNDLRSAGLIEIGRRQIKILNREGLRRVMEREGRSELKQSS